MHIVYFCEKWIDCIPSVVENCAWLMELLSFTGLRAEKFHRKSGKKRIFFTYFGINGIKKLLKYGSPYCRTYNFWIKWQWVLINLYEGDTWQEPRLAGCLCEPKDLFFKLGRELIWWMLFLVSKGLYGDLSCWYCCLVPMYSWPSVQELFRDTCSKVSNFL